MNVNCLVFFIIAYNSVQRYELIFRLARKKEEKSVVSFLYLKKNAYLCPLKRIKQT